MPPCFSSPVLLASAPTVLRHPLFVSRSVLLHYLSLSLSISPPLLKKTEAEANEMDTLHAAASGYPFSFPPLPSCLFFVFFFICTYKSISFFPLYLSVSVFCEPCQRRCTHTKKECGVNEQTERSTKRSFRLRPFCVLLLPLSHYSSYAVFLLLLLFGSVCAFSFALFFPFSLF